MPSTYVGYPDQLSLGGVSVLKQAFGVPGERHWTWQYGKATKRWSRGTSFLSTMPLPVLTCTTICDAMPGSAAKSNAMPDAAGAVCCLGVLDRHLC